jgi:hypothetical protein
MEDYLQFVWESAIHPQSFVDILPAFQLILAVVCWIYIIKAFISIYQYNKQMKNGK